MKQLKDLPFNQQDELRQKLSEGVLRVDTNTRTVKYLGEDIDYDSIVQTQILKG
jgi:glucuronate isomerase